MTSRKIRAASRPISSQPYSEREETILDGLEEIFLQERFRRVSAGELAALLALVEREFRQGEQQPVLQVAAELTAQHLECVVRGVSVAVPLCSLYSFGTQSLGFRIPD